MQQIYYIMMQFIYTSNAVNLHKFDSVYLYIVKKWI